MRLKQERSVSARGSGLKLPVVLTRRISLIGADGLVDYRRSACLIELPCSTASTSRSLKSDDKGAGLVPTEAGFLDDPEQRVQFEAHHLMPITPPEDIAEYAAFLASDKARRVTGAIHLADAGYSCFKGKMDLRDLVST